MLLTIRELAVSLTPREKLAELIRVAVRRARSEGEEAAADELISVLEFMDQESSPTLAIACAQLTH